MHGLIDRLNKFRSETKLDTSIDANTGAIVGTPEATGGRSKRWGLSASTCGAKLNRFNKIGFVLHIPSLPSSRGRSRARTFQSQCAISARARLGLKAVLEQLTGVVGCLCKPAIPTVFRLGAPQQP